MQVLSDDDAMDTIWEKHMNPPRPTVARVRIKSVTLPWHRWKHVDFECFDQVFVENGERALARMSTVRPTAGKKAIQFQRVA